jgi:hypothetical protein
MTAQGDRPQPRYAFAPHPASELRIADFYAPGAKGVNPAAGSISG